MGALAPARREQCKEIGDQTTGEFRFEEVAQRFLMRRAQRRASANRASAARSGRPKASQTESQSLSLPAAIAK